MKNECSRLYIDKIMNLNEKVIIVSIGPLTNIATILIKEPMLREKQSYT